MQAITVSGRDAGVAGLSLTDLPYPQTADNDVVVRLHAAGFTPGELDWPQVAASIRPHLGGGCRLVGKTPQLRLLQVLSTASKRAAA
jgi:hypothetical protein